ncbi:SDR family NAD(P)-dependent oxidoreductase [Gynurincola endophyticus]|uniref:SDR family NAD(P)-dependent oxidoreductase n=1 Tax=Gynurincola endophyticus TaxID=2479004 RepID=UPI000F8D7285|nr:SDR family oxidoreductase [Gynurincola endophyticus]
MFSLSGKIAIITGGASGIGKAIAELFHQQGASVHILDIQKPEDFPVYLTFHTVNITDSVQVQSVVTTFTSLDILVNNAGIAHVGDIETTSIEDFNRVMNVNVFGTFLCTQACIPVMKKNKKGVILNIASIAASAGLEKRFVYSTSKGAIKSMTLSIAKDYVKEGIRCNSISPARVHTPFVDGFLARFFPGKEKEKFEQLAQTQPIGRMAQTNEIALLALYLCSDEAGFITGTDYPIDGGFLTLNGQ